MRVRTRGAIWSRSASAVHAHLATTSRNSHLCGLDHGVRRVLAFKQPSPGIAQTILNGKLDLDDVLVSVSIADSQAGAFDDRVTSHIGRADLRPQNKFVALNRIRQAPIETSAHGAFVLSRTGYDGLLTFLHDKEAVPIQITNAIPAIRPTPTPALFISG